MSDEKELPKDGNILSIPKEQMNEAELEPSENDNVDGLHEAELNPVEAEFLPNIENIDEPEINPIEAELGDMGVNPAETVSKDSTHDSPLEGSVRNSRDSVNDPLLEGTVGGAMHCACGDVHFSPHERTRIKAGKEDIFIKFFSKEYDQARAPILERRRHSARIQRVRRRHVSEDSKLSDPNPLGCLQDAGTSSGAILNQAGAIIGKNIPKEEIPEYKRFGTEFGQSLPLVPRLEGSERSIGSIGTALISEIYGGTVSRTPSNDSRGLSPGSSFPSFSSRPPTGASGDFKMSPPLDSKLPEKDEKSRVTAENETHEKNSSHIDFPVLTLSAPTRSKSAVAGLLMYSTDSDTEELQHIKLSKVYSDPLPHRKISKDSSPDYFDQNLDVEIRYPELAHSQESDLCVPIPDINSAIVEGLPESLNSLTVSDAASSAAMHNVGLEQEVEQNEATGQGSTTAQSFKPGDGVSPQPQCD